MKRLTTFALVTLVALVATGLAIAHGSDTRKTTPVSATFTAAPTEKTTTVQCTGADGTYDVTRGLYEGTATGSDGILTGKISIRTKSVVNTTTGYGYTEGKVTLRDADGKLKAKARLVAVNTKKGTLDGFMDGRVKEQGHLLANFSAAFNADGTALTGELGSGAAQNSAIVTSGGCQRSESEKRSESRKDDDRKSDQKTESRKS
jgi:hypothetical protein